MHGKRRKEEYVKRAELFFRRVYHLVVGSSLTFYLGSVMKFTCKARVFQAEEQASVALTVRLAKRSPFLRELPHREIKLGH